MSQQDESKGFKDRYPAEYCKTQRLSHPAGDPTETIIIISPDAPPKSS